MEYGIIMAILVSIVVGVAIAFQGAVNTLLSKTVGLWEANLVVHLTGFIAVAILLIMGLGQGGLAKIGNAPKISLVGGLMGATIISGAVFTISKLGVSTALALFIFAQMVAAGMIDHYGWLNTQQIAFGWQRALGVFFLLVGVFLMRRY